MPDLPRKILERYEAGEPLSGLRSKLNDGVDAINRLSQGVPPPSQKFPPKPVGSLQIFRVRLVLLPPQDSSTPEYALTGVPPSGNASKEIDGVSARLGDLVLVARDKHSDGIYEVAEGSWTRKFRLPLPLDSAGKELPPRSGEVEDGSPRLTRGDTISVWDGDNFAHSVFSIGDDTIVEN